MGTSPPATWDTVQSASAMNTISAVFLVALAAVEPLSAAATDRPRTCTGILEGDVCAVAENNCGLWFPFLGPPPECTCECVPLEEPVEVCCETKTVGDYNYTKVDWGSGKVPKNCKNDCVYTRDDKAGSKYCFADGEQEVHCLDEDEDMYLQLKHGKCEAKLVNNVCKDEDSTCKRGYKPQTNPSCTKCKCIKKT